LSSGLYFTSFYSFQAEGTTRPNSPQKSKTVTSEILLPTLMSRASTLKGNEQLLLAKVHAADTRAKEKAAKEKAKEKAAKAPKATPDRTAASRQNSPPTFSPPNKRPKPDRVSTPAARVSPPALHPSPLFKSKGGLCIIYKPS
jgi:hypothetical protein